MLLKDFDIRVFHFNKVTGPNQETPMTMVTIEGKVVIKRDKKYYTVDLTQQYEEKRRLYSAAALQSFIADYLIYAKRIDEDWKLVGEVDDGAGGKLVSEKPFEL